MTAKHFGHQFRDHILTRPWGDGTTDTFDLYAREIIPPGGEDYPVVVYLQGGPGFPSPRPLGASGWLGRLLKEYRVVLLDQRGTGRSGRIDRTSDFDGLTVQRLSRLRQEGIVDDAEALREHLGLDKWALYGQSFGGFCITSYLSRYPQSVSTAMMTGGLPATTAPVDDVYRHTFAALRARHEVFYRRVDFADNAIREIAHHLENSQEILPTGERLSARRFRQIGLDLGRGTGFLNLAYLLEDPFTTVRGEKRLKADVLASIGARLTYEGWPLYALIHESIYGGVAGQHVTGWAALRIREEINGFEENADPRDTTRPYYLTGEHIFPWQFEEDPALFPFADLADQLANHQWAASPYDAGVLREANVPVAAAVYLDDIFVPQQYSLATAGHYQDLRPYITNQFQHDGIAHDGEGIVDTLITLLNEY